MVLLLFVSQLVPTGNLARGSKGAGTPWYAIKDRVTSRKSPARTVVGHCSDEQLEISAAGVPPFEIFVRKQSQSPPHSPLRFSKKVKMPLLSLRTKRGWGTRCDLICYLKIDWMSNGCCLIIVESFIYGWCYRFDKLKKVKILSKNWVQW